MAVGPKKSRFLELTHLLEALNAAHDCLPTGKCIGQLARIKRCLTSDPLMLQTMYAQFLREIATRQDVTAMQQFTDTATGAGWLKTENVTELRMTAELARMQTEYQARHYKTFLDEQQRIYAAFQNGLKARK